MGALKALVVDDIKLERQCIAFLVEKYELPLTLTMAENGQEALRLIASEPFDILLTDIKMPVMDGLALTRATRNLQPDLKIAIISGFGEFAYARSAMALGVQDYLLKPIDPAEVSQVLRKMINAIHLQRGQYKLREQEAYFIRRHLLHALINGVSPRTLYEMGGSLDFVDAYGHMALLEVGSCLSGGRGADFVSYLDALVPQGFEALHLSLTQVLFFIRKHGGCPIAEQTLVRQAEGLCEALLADMGAHCHIALSAPLSPGGIHAAYRELDALIDKRYFFPSQRVLLPGAGGGKAYDDLEKTVSDIEGILSDRSAAALDARLDELQARLARSTRYDETYIKLLLSNITSAIIMHLPQDVKSSAARSLRSIAAGKTLEAGMAVVRHAAGLLETDRDAVPCSRLERVKQYIADNYDKDLGLEELAGVIYVHPDYLCRIFKKETGENLTKFLRAYRIGKACELLRESSMKVVDISKAVGYQNPSYFCHCFREHYGVSPETFRREGEKHAALGS